ncbi:MAG: filamentous hemagglutinin N-terminal domain-containing protein [Burkholderiaceae bacterium]|nr:filamentous hemagglutinin N-terminal domain-containing protein [Burkholderiaceae bacterium]
MNHVYQLVWSEARDQYVVTSEITRRPGRKGGAMSVVAVGSLLAGLLGPATAQVIDAHTLPTGGHVTAGAATLATSGATLNVNQTSDRAAINWQSFSVGTHATVNFNQPNASSITLNRVVGNEGSIIAGSLSATGQVFVLNSNGVLFAQGAQVNVGGIVASTLGMTDADFMAGKASFTSNGSRASVINMGTITTADGGYAALLGNQVKNQGVMVARLGTAALAAGDKVSLNFNGNSLVGVAVEQGTLNALVENGQAIRADGGLVVLTAKGLDTVLSTMVNNSGEVRAQTVENRAGKIFLLGDLDHGAVNVAGKLDAAAPSGGNGGFIETSAAKVSFAPDVQITTKAAAGSDGQWLIDPVDFTIAAAGGDISGTQLGTLLDSNSITIQTLAGSNTSTALYGTTGANGDIHVNDAVSWTGANTLTLNAHRNINVNANISGSDPAAGVIFLYGQGSADGGAATFSQSNSATITAASQQWRKGSDLDGIRYAIVDGHVFLGGKFIEVGINRVGYFGANGTTGSPRNYISNAVFPSLFYGRQTGFGVGMTGAANGFANSFDKTTNTATAQDLRIDYFLPGSPFENMSFGAGSTTLGSTSFNSSTLPVTTVELMPLGSDNVMKAKITSTRGDMEVSQVISFGKTDKYFNNAVTLKNVGATSLSDVSFVRNFDPDNTVDIGRGGGVYDTIQKLDRSIAAGDSVTIVSATSPLVDPWSDWMRHPTTNVWGHYGTLTPEPYYTAAAKQSVIFYSTTDSRVSMGFDTSWNSQPFWGRDIAAMSATIATQVKGNSTIGLTDANPDGSFDGAMGLLFRGGDLAAGASVNFNYNTVLAMGTVDQVLAEIPGLGGGRIVVPTGPRESVIDAARGTTALPREGIVPSLPVTAALGAPKAVGFSNVTAAPAVIESAFGPGASLALISSPRGDEPTQVVSISEASSMLKPAGKGDGDDGSAAGGDREVRVPASRDSLVEIVNGGVKLPTGVEQQLFVVKSN